MKSKIISIFASVAVMTGVASCDDYKPAPDADGYGKLDTASILVEVSNAENIIKDSQGALKPQSAAASRGAIDMSDFNVSVTDANGKEVNNWKLNAMPELPVFPAGQYTVTVTSGDEPTQPAWDAPYFRGSQPFEIKANEVTDVETIVCRLANIKVSVRFTDALKAAATAGDVKVVVRSEGASSMMFTNDETRSAYFPAAEGLTTLSAAFSGTIYNGKEQFTKAIQNVEAGQHRIITYGLRRNDAEAPEESGTIDLDGSSINVSTGVIEEDLTVDMPWEDDILDDSKRPGQETGGDDPTPPTPPVTGDEITLTTSLGENDLTKVYDIDEFQAEGWKADLNINATAGIRSVMVKIDSPVLPPEELEGIGLQPEFDLVNPGSLAAALEGLGFPTINEGDTKASFEVTTFIGMLGSLGPGQSNFHVTVTDMQGNEKTASLMFNKAE